MIKRGVVAVAAVTALSAALLCAPKKKEVSRPATLYGRVMVEELEDPRLAEVSLPSQWKEKGKGNWFKGWGEWRAAVFAENGVSLLLINLDKGQTYYYRFTFSPSSEPEVKGGALYVEGAESILVIGKDPLGNPYLEIHSPEGRRVSRTTFY